MLTNNLALVSEVAGHDPSDVSRVAAALQRQATRDFEPVWDVRATVDAFPRLEDVPLGYWPVIVRDDIHDPGAAGVHLDRNGQPFALVQVSDQWTLTASHEVLEMSADPFGSRLIPSRSPKRRQGRVEFLVEVCDPCEAAEFSYHVNGVAVSDFYTPHYFEPAESTGVRYSFTGAIARPRQVLKGGYLSWHDPVSDHWWQETYFGSKPTYRDLGVIEKSADSLRTEIDRRTPRPETLEDALDPRFAAAARTSLETHAEATAARAEALREEVEELLAQAGATATRR
jgi:hypothetical protein